MATPEIVTDREFRQSVYRQMVEVADGVRIANVITRAEAHIQSLIRHRIPETTYTEIHRPRGVRLLLHKRPLTAVTSIKRRLDHHDDWIILDLAHVEIDLTSGVVRSLEEDEVAGYEVEVVYTAGYDPIPEDLKQAVMMQTALYLYADQELVSTGDSKAPGFVKPLKDDIKEIVANYRQTRVF